MPFHRYLLDDNLEIIGSSVTYYPAHRDPDKDKRHVCLRHQKLELVAANQCKGSKFLVVFQRCYIWKKYLSMKHNTMFTTTVTN